MQLATVGQFDALCSKCCSTRAVHQKPAALMSTAQAAVASNAACSGLHRSPAGHKPGKSGSNAEPHNANMPD